MSLAAAQTQAPTGLLLVHAGTLEGVSATYSCPDWKSPFLFLFPPSKDVCVLQGGGESGKWNSHFCAISMSVLEPTSPVTSRC